MKITLVSVFVKDPVEAHHFYTELLGFRTQRFMPEANLAIVVSPEQPEGTSRRSTRRVCLPSSLASPTSNRNSPDSSSSALSSARNPPARNGAATPRSSRIPAAT